MAPLSGRQGPARPWSARGGPSNDDCSELSAQDKFNNLRVLREKAELQIREVHAPPKRPSAARPASARGERGSTPAQTPTRPGTAGRCRQKDQDQEPRLGGGAVQQLLRKKAADTKELQVNVERCLESIDKAIFRARRVLSELQHARSGILAHIRLAEARLEARTRRPQTEQVPDSFQEALETERGALRQARDQMTAELKTGQGALTPLEQVRAEMVQSRLTLHLDRTGNTQKLLSKASSLEEALLQHCEKIEASMQHSSEEVEFVREMTMHCMKMCINETMRLRKKMTQEVSTASETLAEMERLLEQKQRQVARQSSLPEQRFRLASGHNQSKSQYDVINERYSDALGKLRSKIKGAAYTGPAGRQLQVVFARFDKDHSGELDEDELRQAIRKTMKVPPALFSDAEIHSLYALLDTKKNGTLSIEELANFLESGDAGSELLEQECASLRQSVKQLGLARDEAAEALRCKTAAWQVDVSCSKLSVRQLAMEAPRRGARASVFYRGTASVAGLPLEKAGAADLTGAPAAADER
eukprot:TRINITY_DN11607_c0_g1_i1.p1 TRINITY_DN11607_c0_g1~~TRINITY_DN11607_c0_g1_i1.p1  ORF type:complete len:532 (+),score=108.69 TRINITY_DN11607_c0_g1_i1:169-1764(+)